MARRAADRRSAADQTGWRFDVSCTPPPLPVRPVGERDDLIARTESMLSEFVTLDADHTSWSDSQVRLIGVVIDNGFHRSADTVAPVILRLLRWAVSRKYAVRAAEPDLTLDNVTLTIIAHRGAVNPQ